MKNSNSPLILSRLEQAHQCLHGFDRQGVKTHKATYDEGVLSFIEGGAPRRPHHSVIQAMAAALFDGSVFPIESYTNYDILPALYDGARDQFLAWGIPQGIAENLSFANGSLQVFNSFLRSAFNPGDLLLTGKSFYHAFSRPPFKCGLEMAAVETCRENQYNLVADDIEKWMVKNPGKNPRGLVISSPSPIGAIYNEQQLADLACIVRKLNLIVYVDAVYKGAEYDGQNHPVLASFPGMENHVVTASSVSKIHGCANLRMGWACGPKPIIDNMIKDIVDEVTTICQLNQIGAAQALKVPGEYLRENIAEAHMRAHLIAGLVQTIQQKLENQFISKDGQAFIEVETMPRSGYSILLNFPALQGLSLPCGCLIESDLEITRHLLNHGIAVSPTSSTGFEGECCVRVAFAEIPETTDDGQQTMSDAQNAQSDFEKTRERIKTAFEVNIYNAIAEILTCNQFARSAG